MNTWKTVRRTAELSQATDAYALKIWNEVLAMGMRPELMTASEFDHAVRVAFNNLQGDKHGS